MDNSKIHLKPTTETSLVFIGLLYLHFFSVCIFRLAHGVSVGIVLRLRSERDPQRVSALLELSRNSVGFIHLSLFLVLATGMVLGLLGDW